MYSFKNYRGIVGNCYQVRITINNYSFPEHHSYILDFFVKILLKPSHLFYKGLEKRTLISFRECVNRSILRCIRSSDNTFGLAKSLLFSFLKAFISTSLNKWSLINSMYAIVSLSDLLNPTEVCLRLILTIGFGYYYSCILSLIRRFQQGY